MMARILMIVAQNGFRDEELLVPKAIFERAGHQVKTASILRSKASGSKGASINVDFGISEYSIKTLEEAKHTYDLKKENYLILDKWFFDKTGKHRLDSNKCSYWHYPEYCGVCCALSQIYDEYKEITFEQFKKYVLKQDDIEKEIVG